MKRAFIALLLVLLIFGFAQVNAQDDEITETKNADRLEDQKNKLRGVLEKGVILPNQISNIAKILFQIKEPVYLGKFIVYCCFFLLIVIILYNIARLADFPGGRFIIFLVVLILTLIGSVGGGLSLIGEYYIGLLNNIALFEKLPILVVSLTIILFLLVMWIIGLLSKFMEGEKGMEDAYADGLEVNKNITIIKRLSNFIRKS